MSRLNVFDDEPWDMTAEKMRVRTRFLGMPSGAKELGASLHELLPGSTGFHLHAHYGMEEMFFVLSGHPELGKVAVSTRNPFEPVPEGGDKGIVAMFDIPPES